MGLSKQYLRYLPFSQFGVVASQRCNVLFLSMRNSSTRYVAAGSCEHVNIWDVKTNRKVMVLKGEKYSVTCLAKSPSGHHLAVGYSDGSLRIFSLMTSEVIVTYSGHSSSVSCVAYDSNGMRLASGSNDSEIIVWDLVNECGLYKLNGHKEQITACCFVSKRNMLITSSKDTFIKWWDLDTQHCFKTMVGHRAEVWDFVLSPDNEFLITGSSDSSLRVWKVQYNNENDNFEPVEKRQKTDSDSEDEHETTSQRYGVVCTKFGSFLREETDRVVSLCLSPDGKLIVCHGNNKTIELFKVRSEDEIKTHMKKKIKKLKKKDSDNKDEETAIPNIEASDKFVHIGKFRVPGKMKSVDVTKIDGGDGYQIVTLLHNNQLIIQEATAKLRLPELTPIGKLFSSGHRSACRSATFSSDGLAVLTASTNSVKMWNRVSQQCIQTSETDHATVCKFVPGDKQFLVGTMNGKLEIHDVPSGRCVEKITAHPNVINDVALFADKRGFATCSKDQSVKFWDFDLILDEDFSSSTKRLTATHSRTLQLDEEVNVVEFSQNRKLIACALLNCSVKVFYVDSLKFFLSLYGHSLPVTCMSITSDSSLIATGSSDKNIKFWGLDFGDCHKSIFAHDDNITSMEFVPDTHLLFTAGKDGSIKQWDGDKFIHIQTLQGHHGPVWCITSDPQGDYIASCGADVSLRLWTRSSEIVIPDEEHEREREEEDEKRLVKNLSVTGRTEEGVDEATRASKPTIKTIQGAEQIMEAIELHREEKEKGSQIAPDMTSTAQIHPTLLAYGNISSEKYVLQILKKIKSADLEESLLVLPFSYVPDFLKLLNEFVSNGWEVELSCRCLLYLLKVHQGVISSSDVLVPVLEHLQENTESGVKKLQDTIGFNMAALNHLKRQIEAKNEIMFFDDATEKFSQKTKKKKKKLNHAIITI
uniref:WD repeat-containing protein 3-like n=1 Tax=Styela clava TaxID=7725 RepID=UPI00193A1500|nr:WD repeat-containing protein 3-like [Styela clava]